MGTLAKRASEAMRDRIAQAEQQVRDADAALQAACPVVIAPRFGPLPDMDPGQRLVVAANGLFVTR